MRNTALSTCTTNSRGVKSSLSRMTFHSGGRCVFGLGLLRWLTKVGLIMAVLAPGGGRRARPDHDSTHHPFRQAGCLALQLRSPFYVGSAGFGLMCASPDGPCDDVGGPDASLRKTNSDAPDFLN